MTNTPGPLEGHDAPWVNPPRDELSCPICTLVARDAAVAEDCGHLFCQSCVVETLRHKPECPVCRQPIRPEGIRKDLRARREINNLPVVCENVKKGCPWSGTLSGLNPHLAEDCNFVVVKCPNKHCDLFMQRCMLPVHLCINQFDESLFPEEDEPPEERESAAVTLQAWFRGCQQRRLFRRLRFLREQHERAQNRLVISESVVKPRANPASVAS
eukprot:TRINITY_DN9454_c0_g1_i1.p1 TRINITY_DN9454_c0_g1~~TRINITY_DN9454_c0_g1_i1.p1  ORF type:complete len:227 (-),score=21.37 TRINITY_DN9454_c0_g1_i1:61-702(-)